VLKGFILLYLLVIFSNFDFAGQYYIDILGGNNSNTGESETSAWKDFSPVNSRTFSGGDKIFLIRGGVWNQQLIINGSGDPGNFIEVSAYGTGSRPHIRRNGDIADRCMRLNNSSYVKVSSLAVSNGGAGIVVYYDHDYNNTAVYFDNIVAHDFFGIYRASGEYGCDPSW